MIKRDGKRKGAVSMGTIPNCAESIVKGKLIATQKRQFSLSQTMLSHQYCKLSYQTSFNTPFRKNPFDFGTARGCFCREAMKTWSGVVHCTLLALDLLG